MKSIRIDSILDAEEIEALRTLVLHLKAQPEKSRYTIASEAQVLPIDIDNFTTKRTPASKNNGQVKFKTTTPNNIFQSRMLKYLFGYVHFREGKIIYGLGDIDETARCAFNTLLPAIIRIAVDNISDSLFDYLEKIGILSTDKAKEIIEKIEGNFYGYRLSTYSDQAIKTFFEILEFDIYRKTPTFLHRLKTVKGEIREAVGNIIELSDYYIFLGFIRKPGKKFSGVKVLILNHEGFNHTHTLSGIYISMDVNQTYDIGNIKLIRTRDEYSEQNIGFVPKTEIPFDRSDLFIDLSKVMKNMGNEKSGYQNAMIGELLASSINFLIGSKN